MTLGRKLEMIELALYSDVKSLDISSYSIDEQKIFKTPRDKLFLMEEKTIEKIAVYGIDFDPATAKFINENVPIHFGGEK